MVIFLSEKRETACDKGQKETESHLAESEEKLNYTRKRERKGHSGPKTHNSAWSLVPR